MNVQCSQTAGRAVIIGAGLGGLATALRLATRGWRVRVCERSGTPGGKMNRWRAAGCTFDTGPSLITMPWVFEELFADAGERLADYACLIPVHPLAEYVFADGDRFAYSPRLPEWLAAVRTREGGRAETFLRHMALGARLFELSKASFFRSSPFDRPDPAALSALKYMPLRHVWGSYAETVRHFYHDPHLRQMFLRYPTYVGSAPERVPAMLTVIPYLEYAFGVHHIEGGLYTLIEALTALLQARGVELRWQAPAVAIERAGERIAGVRLADGTRWPADVVVMNGDVSRSPALLGQPESPSLPESERSLSGLVFLWAVQGRLEGRAHHTVFFSSDYPREFHELFDERRFPADPTVYVNLPARSDPSMAGPNAEPIFVMANAPANDGDPWDEAMIAEARRRVVARLRAGGFPDVEHRLVAESVWTPRRMAETYDMPGGAIYGTHSHGIRRAFFRPPNRDRRIHGLYYVGGSTHPGGGTPTVLLSARMVSEHILRHRLS